MYGKIKKDFILMTRVDLDTIQKIRAKIDGEQSGEYPWRQARLCDYVRDLIRVDLAKSTKSSTPKKVYGNRTKHRNLRH